MNRSAKPRRDAIPADVAEHVAQNIETMVALHARGEEQVGRQQRAVERLTSLLGRPSSAYVVVASVAGWIAWNALAPGLGLRSLDAPPFPWLQGAVGLCALLMTFMVLITQNRLAKRAAQREHLDLQLNLTAEQKVAKLISLVEELRRDLPAVRDRIDPVAQSMSEAFDPHAVASALEQTIAPPGEPGTTKQDPEPD